MHLKNKVKIIISFSLLVIFSLILFTPTEKLSAGPCLGPVNCSSGCPSWYSGTGYYCVFGKAKVLSCTASDNTSCPTY